MSGLFIGDENGWGLEGVRGLGGVRDLSDGCISLARGTGDGLIKTLFLGGAGGFILGKASFIGGIMACLCPDLVSGLVVSCGVCFFPDPASGRVVSDPESLIGSVLTVLRSCVSWVESVLIGSAMVIGAAWGIEPFLAASKSPAIVRTLYTGEFLGSKV